MDKAKLTYNRKLPGKTRQPLRQVNTNDFVFLCEKYHNPEKEDRYKLYPIDDGPYRVVFADEDPAILDIKDQH